MVVTPDSRDPDPPTPVGFPALLGGPGRKF
jgi:hypothetical protein